jgi:hypothetical protein
VIAAAFPVRSASARTVIVYAADPCRSKHEERFGHVALTLVALVLRPAVFRSFSFPFLSLHTPACLVFFRQPRRCLLARVGDIFDDAQADASRPHLSPVTSAGNERQPYASIGTTTSYACHSFAPRTITPHLGMGDYSFHSLANMGPQGRWRRPLLIAIPVVLLFIIYSSSFSYTPSSATQTQIEWAALILSYRSIHLR